MGGFSEGMRKMRKLLTMDARRGGTRKSSFNKTEVRKFHKSGLAHRLSREGLKKEKGSGQGPGKSRSEGYRRPHGTEGGGKAGGHSGAESC